MENPIVLAAAIGAVAGLAGGVVGVVGSAFFAWRLDVGRSNRAAAADRDSRIRTFRLTELEATRRYMVDQLDFSVAFILLRDRDAVGPTRDDGRRSNIYLVGQFDVVKAYTDQLVELMERVTVGILDTMIAYWRPRTLREVDPEELARSAKIRSDVIAALDAQELRLHRGEDLLKMTDEEITSLPGPQAFVEMMRRRTGRRSATKNGGPLSAD
jgi:hypothetical protein